MLRIFRYEVSSLVYTIEKCETEHLLDWRQCGGGGGGAQGRDSNSDIDGEESKC